MLLGILNPSSRVTATPLLGLKYFVLKKTKSIRS